jgi:hypothetical protein
VTRKNHSWCKLPLSFLRDLIWEGILDTQLVFLVLLGVAYPAKKKETYLWSTFFLEYDLPMILFNLNASCHFFEWHTQGISS